MRKNTVKKILAALLALGAISTLTACNNSQTTAQSTAESSKSVSESSTESSSQESSAESSIESSVESSKAVSESSVESSKESSTESSSESSVESSKAISESSEESSDESSEIPVYQVESKKASFNNVTRYGKVLKTAKLKSKDTTARILKDYLVSILNVNDSTYELYWGGYSITVDSSLIELFDEDYKPDFSLRYWQGIEDEYLNL